VISASLTDTPTDYFVKAGTAANGNYTAAGTYAGTPTASTNGGYGAIGNLLMMKPQFTPVPAEVSLYAAHFQFIKPYIPLYHRTVVHHYPIRIAQVDDLGEFGDTVQVWGGALVDGLKVVVPRTRINRIAVVNSSTVNGGSSGSHDFSALDTAITAW
jgi:hypothetical protein